MGLIIFEWDEKQPNKYLDFIKRSDITDLNYGIYFAINIIEIIFVSQFIEMGGKRWQQEQ